MNSAALARSAYQQSTAIAPAERTAEYRAFAQVTAALATAARTEGLAGVKEMAQAIRQNRRLWGVLAADAASDGNRLSPALRAQIVSLAAFTWSHSSRVLKGEASAEALIEINTAIMRGLRGADAGA